MSDKSATGLSPRLLSMEEAAAYCGVGVDLFLEEVRSGVWPQGRRRGLSGRRVTWDRKLLDLAEDRRSGFVIPEPANDVISHAETDAWENRINAAISNKRSKGRP